VSLALAKERSRYAINRIGWSAADGVIEFVATDGRQLAVARGPCGQGRAQGILHASAHDDLETDADLDLWSDSFSIAGKVLFASSESREFPPWRQVVPGKPRFTAEVKLNWLLYALQESDEEVILFVFTGNFLQLRKLDVWEIKCCTPCKCYTPCKFVTKFRLEYLIPFLKRAETAIGDDVIHLQFTEPDRPVRIDVGDDWTYVLMPVRIDEKELP
jgi:DNA polymerase III sliding clamp (beta) subunit (PCNA family)